MRNSPFFLLAVGLFMACNSASKYAESITSLSTDWKAATDKVTAFMSQVSEENKSLSQMAQAMVMPAKEDAMKMGEEGVANMQQAINDFQANSGAVSALSQEVAAYAGDWQGLSAKMEGLLSGLEAKSLGDDTEATINELKEALAGTEAKMGGWEQALSTAKTAAEAAYKQFMSMVPAQEG